MSRNKLITVIDVIIYLLNDILGWFIIIIFDSTGEDCKFQNITAHYIFLIIGIIHILVSIWVNLMFYKKERTKYHIQIKRTVLFYNFIMTLLPYLYLLFCYI